MQGPSTNSENRDLNFEALPIRTVALSQQNFDEAVVISDLVVTESQQWQIYLNALALFGLNTWLSENAPDLFLDLQHCSLFKPQYANLIDVTYDLRINNYKACLVPIGGTVDSTIKLPRAVMDLAEYRSHFYILIKVLEEQGQAQVQSFLRYDQWADYQQACSLSPQPDWSYQVPSEWFDSNLQHLLLHLQCLDNRMIALPRATATFSEESAPDKQNLLRRFSRVKSFEIPIWQLLSWEEGVKVLTNPALLEWLYQVQTGQIKSQMLQATTLPLFQPVLNAWNWLQDEVDDTVEFLGWSLLPPFAELRGGTECYGALLEQAPRQELPDLMSVVEEIDLIRKKLARESTTLPSDARCIYKDLSLAETSLRLYVITWFLRDNAGTPSEWVLLPILKNLTGDNLQHEAKLSVKDQANLLVECSLTPTTDNNFIYAHVIGDLDEAFLITITLDNGKALTLPPFVFNRCEL